MTIETYTQKLNASQLENADRTGDARTASSSQESLAATSTSLSPAPTAADLTAPRNLRTEELRDPHYERSTPIHNCIREELREYLDLLNGETPTDLHRLVMQQVESALFGFVMEECRGNQSKAAAWLGISRGTLRTRLAALNLR